jgi:nitric oxide reductase NorE protein
MSVSDHADTIVEPGIAEHSPAIPGIWAFVTADCVGFAIFFFVFMTERLKQPALFDESSQHLDVRIGLANTLILITSSWLVALAAQATKHGQLDKARRLLPAALIVSCGFAVLKSLEYGIKINAGITPLTNPFFMFYFVLTGIHFLHYAVGIAVLAVMITKSRNVARDPDRFANWMESGGIYWHLVDLLWCFLFPMLYLLGGGQ